jgi:hypothetical protein
VGNRADILVRAQNDELKLFVQVKSGARSSADWAAKFRRNLVEYQLIPKTEYFLLALPDYLYLWKETNTLEIVPPDYIVRTFNVLQQYLGSSDVEPAHIAKEGLHMALVGWLHRLIFPAKRPPAGSDAYKFLVESGLLDAIDNGEVTTRD